MFATNQDVAAQISAVAFRAKTELKVWLRLDNRKKKSNKNHFTLLANVKKSARKCIVIAESTTKDAQSYAPVRIAKTIKSTDVCSKAKRRNWNSNVNVLYFQHKKRISK